MIYLKFTTKTKYEVPFAEGKIGSAFSLLFRGQRCSDCDNCMMSHVTCIYPGRRIIALKYLIASFVSAINPVKLVGHLKFWLSKIKK